MREVADLVFQIGVGADQLVDVRDVHVGRLHSGPFVGRSKAYSPPGLSRETCQVRPGMRSCGCMPSSSSAPTLSMLPVPSA